MFTGKLASTFRRFLRSTAGNFAATVAVAAPALLGASGLALDYVSLHGHRKSLQAAADGAALAAVRELMVAGTSDSQVQAVASNFVASNLSDHSMSGDLVVKAVVDRTTQDVRVDISYAWLPMFAQLFDKSATPVERHAVARLAGKGLTCAIGLMQPERFSLARASIHMDNDSRLLAEGCSVYSNSHDRYSVRMDGGSSMRAQSICAAGGVYARGGSYSFEPRPILDCPKVDDPLEMRSPPPVSPCIGDALVIDHDATLNPGTYCNGLTISGDAEVRLKPGIYIIKDGPLIVTGNAALIGDSASFYLTGDKSIFEFHENTTIRLEAMASGPLAGLLFFEDRSVPHSFRFNPFRLDQIPEEVRVHRITSNDARMLLGTLYLKRSILLINANAPVADASAYTALVVGRLWLQEGPILYLNADYTETAVPVPDGLIGYKPTLIQ